jgi:CRP/FNR family transcriptional regulator
MHINQQAQATDSSIAATSRFLKPAAGRQAQSFHTSTMSEVCRLMGLTNIAVPSGGTQFVHMRVKMGERLYTVGQAFDTLYVINSGFMKTVRVEESGAEKVMDFPMRGDVLGIDAVHAGVHPTEAVALSDTDVIAIPYATLMSLTGTHAGLEGALLGLFSQHLAQAQHVMGMICMLSAEARVARFVLGQGTRFASMGYSGRQFSLRMTRYDIGSYLGLTLETVSRSLNGFYAMGWIRVEQRLIEVLDADAMASVRRLPVASARPPIRRNCSTFRVGDATGAKLSLVPDLTAA